MKSWTERFRDEVRQHATSPVGVSVFLGRYGMGHLEKGLGPMLLRDAFWELKERVGVRGISRCDSIAETLPLVLELALLKFGKYPK